MVENGKPKSPAAVLPSVPLQGISSLLCPMHICKLQISTELTPLSLCNNFLLQSLA